MPIEAFNFIANLVSAYPQSGDTKSQGDDHLRGLKQTLLNTFPDADRAFRIPRVREILSASTPNVTLTVADENRLLYCRTGGGVLTLTLPTLAAGVSWECRVMKGSSEGNPVFVQTPGGQFINGVAARLRVQTIFEEYVFGWNGSVYFKMYNGPIPNIVYEIPLGSATPSGYANCNGQTLSPSTDYPELVAYLGTATLPNLANHIIRLC